MLHDGSWKGQDALLVGGGPSLADFDWLQIRSYPRCIVVNRAFLDVPNAAYFVSEDARFFSRFAPQLREFKGVKIFSCPDSAYHQEVFEADSSAHRWPWRDKRWGWGTTLFDDGHGILSSSSNSMIPAMNLATILGATTIYLLGVDCRMPSGQQNYHDSYPRDWRISPQVLQGFASDFEFWAAIHLRRLGVSVVNVVNPKAPSALTCWPVLAYSEFYALMSSSVLKTP